jgi:hypothetical protein
VLADDFLFRNVSLLVDDNAVLLDHLLRDSGTTIELAGDLTGLVASNPIQSVRRGPLGASALAARGLSACVLPVQRRPLWSAGGRGNHPAARILRTRARRGLALCSGARRALGAWLSRRLRQRSFARAFSLRADRSLSGLAEAVATRTGRSVGEVMRLLVEARDASKGEPAEKDARDLETASELCKLLEETGGTGGHKPIQSHV